MNKIELMLLTRNHRPEDLNEWVAYHLAIGFDKITIFDNESVYRIKDLFKENNKVEVREIKGWANQNKLFIDFCNEKRGITEWICFLDDDEYIYIKDNKSIKEMLREEYPVICMYWKFMSTPILIEDREATIINAFNHTTLVSPWTGVSYSKCIVNLNAGNNISWCDPHLPLINGHREGYTVEGERCVCPYKNIDSGFYNRQSLIVYHYFYQSWKDWEWKLNSGNVNLNITYDKDPIRKLDKKMVIEALKNYTEIDNAMIERKKELL